MKDVITTNRRRGRSLPLVVLLVMLAWACDSGRLPTSLSPTPEPTPAPTPAPTAPTPTPAQPPVAAENGITLPAPAVPPSSATDPLVGRYTLEVVVAACEEAVPEHARRRIYTADVHQFRDYYAAKLYDATFLRDGTRVGYGCVDSRLETGGVCHQFIVKRDGEATVSVIMTPEDEWRGSEIWEVQDGHLIQLYGYGTGSIDQGRIVVSGSGGVWYGNGIPASDFSGCGPGDIAWTFTRR